MPRWRWTSAWPWWAWASLPGVLVLGLVAVALAWPDDVDETTTAATTPPSTTSTSSTSTTTTSTTPQTPPPPTATDAARATTTTSRTGPASGAVPGVVVAAARSSAGSGEVQIDWYAVPSATGYRVLRTNPSGGRPRVMADFNITTGRTTSAPEVVGIWSAEHSYDPDPGPNPDSYRGPLARTDQSPWFEYVDVGNGERCYQVLAYNRAGKGPPSPVTCAFPIGQGPTTPPPTT